MAGKGATPKGEYVGKSKVFSTRIRPDLRRKLDSSSKKSGRSVSQEVEHRLRRSFMDDEKISEMFGDERTFALMRLIALGIYLSADPLDPSKWLEDPAMFERAVSAALNVLEAIRPIGETLEDPAQQRQLQTQGQRAAFRIWRAVKRADPTLPLDRGSREEQRHSVLKSYLKGTADDALE